MTDDAITQFLRRRSADADVGLLRDIMRTVEAAPQDRPWLRLRPIRLARRTLLIVATALLLATMGAIALGSGLLQPDLPVEPAPLPATPDAWSRVLIESEPGPDAVTSLAAGPRGLLAVVERTNTPDEQAARLVASADGRNWTLVPADQHPPLVGAAVIGTDQGFLMVGREVWTSEDGYNWQRLAGSAEDPDLLEGRMLAAVAAGPGLVAVGSDNKAWYSTDGSDWSLAEVPPPPAEIFEREGYPAPTVRMQGVAVAGDKLVAWGGAEATNAADSMVAPVLWASSNGLSWTNVLDPQIGTLFAVAGGPGGFVALAETQGSRDGVWFSPDGQAWERVDVFDSRWSEVDFNLVDEGWFGVDFNLVNDEGMYVKLMMKSVAATSAGYVAVGGDGLCALGSCLSAEALIWTSADGRSWSRLPSDDLFKVTEPRDPAYTSGAWAVEVVAWGSRFVVGGVYDGRPAIWISDSAQTPGGGEPSPAAADGSPSPVSTEESNGPAPSDGRAVAFAGVWDTTDGDGSHPTMEVITLSNGTYGVTIRDDLASVCDGAPSTMTGVAEVGEPGTFVIGQPVFVCDDGSQPQALSGPPLEEQLKDLGFVYDSRGDSLRDSLGGQVWTRSEVAP